MPETFPGRRDFAFSNIIKDLSERVMSAKKSGRKSLDVMKVPSSELIRGWFGLWYSLDGCSKEVFNFCKKRRFKVCLVRTGRVTNDRKIVIRC